MTAVLALVLMVGLKLGGLLTWSWWVVLAPAWLYALGVGALLASSVAIGTIALQRELEDVAR
jgi:hypothetical protein